MTLPVDFPNAEVLVVDYLDSQFAFPVMTTVPDPRPDVFALVRRVGGVALNPVADGPMLAVESWDMGDPVAAGDRLQEIRTALHRLPGTALAGHPVYRVIEVAGPANLPDPDSDHDRYTMTVQLSIRGWAT
jgi:hypothetical protein